MSRCAIFWTKITARYAHPVGRFIEGATDHRSRRARNLRRLNKWQWIGPKLGLLRIALQLLTLKKAGSSEVKSQCHDAFELYVAAPKICRWGLPSELSGFIDQTTAT